MKYIKILLVLFLMGISRIEAYYEAPVDITKLNVYEIQDQIDKGYLTYELLIRLYLDRIEAYDKNYKAIISINENAISEAQKCDLEYKKNRRTNILWCIPIIVKDNIDVKGLPTTVGSKALSDSYPNDDAFVIQKLKEKGMIVLAKANMSQYAFSASSSSSYYGTVKNAYDLAYSSYGSSGGSAVAVAAQYAPFALGTDTNSSLRAPASANGVVGFRSTFGLIDTKGIFAYDITRDVVGPITKTASENALIMEALTGKKMDASKTSLEGKKIAVLDQFLYGDSNVYGTATTNTDSEIVKLFEEAVKKMEESGATIIHLKDFYLSKYETIGDKTLGGSTMCHAFKNYIKNTSSKIKTFYDLANASGNIYSLWSYYAKCDVNVDVIKNYDSVKEPFSKALKTLFETEKIDAIIYPNSKRKLLKHGEESARITSYAIAPVLGVPAISMPLGFDKDGLSYGIEFLSQKNCESELYEIVSAYEKINPTYKLPAIAPNLYELPEEVQLLKDEYEKGIKLDISTIIRIINKDLNTDKLERKISDFFHNYNDYDDKVRTAKNLLNEYEELTIKSIKYIKVLKIRIFGLIIFLFIIIVLLFKKNCKPKKSKKIKNK